MFSKATNKKLSVSNCIWGGQTCCST